jgi:hypothetical protein
MKCTNESTAPLASKLPYDNREYAKLAVLKQNNATNENQKQVAKRYGSNFGHHNISFIICRNCFWCASLLSIRASNEHICPNCSKNKLESIPIALTEKLQLFMM